MTTTTTTLTTTLPTLHTRSHGFSYWPGQTLNPAVWDLSKFSAAHEKGAGTLLFEPDDRRFEQSWSLRCLAAGLQVGYLARETFRHEGLEVSAYSLNGMARPWDPDAAKAGGS